jgi:hypothetical protein
MPDLPAIPGDPPPLPFIVPATAVVAPTRRPMAALYRALVALAAAAAVGTEVILGSPLQVLSHFSVQTGALVAVVFALSSLRSWTARRSVSPLVTGGTVLYALIAGLVYHVVLMRGTTAFVMTGTGPTDAAASLTGWHALTNFTLHTALPLAVAADWLLLTRPAPFRLTYATTWLLYPLMYLAFTLARGALLPDGSSPPYLYPFLNVDAHGYKSVLGNALLLGLAFYALALTLVVLDHVRPNPVRHPRGRRPRRPRRTRRNHRGRLPQNRISSPATGGLK